MTDRSRNQAETRRKVSSALARVFAFWRTGLPRPVLVLQGGNALNYFGTGLILPFEIIYLHTVRGFSASALRLRASSSRLPIITSRRSRASTSSTQSHSSASRWLCSPGSRILASRMLRRQARAHRVSELLLGIGSCSP